MELTLIKPLFDYKSITSVAISSVVPRITEKLKEISEKYLKLEPLLVGPGIKTGLNVKTDNPREVGADLICAAVAVEDLSNPMLVVDLGKRHFYQILILKFLKKYWVLTQSLVCNQVLLMV